MKASDLTSDVPDFDTLQSLGFFDAYVHDFQAGKFTINGLTEHEAAVLRHPANCNLLTALVATAPSFARMPRGSTAADWLHRTLVDEAWQVTLRAGLTYHDRGQESNVYTKGDDRVYKFRLSNGRGGAYGLRGSLLQVLYHNVLFPYDAYILHGIVREPDAPHDSPVKLLLSQPAVKIRINPNGIPIAPSWDDIDAAMPNQLSRANNEGFYSSASSESDHLGHAYYNELYFVTDLAPGRNTVIDDLTGQIRFIDPRILPNDPNGVITGVERFGVRDESIILQDPITQYRSFLEFMELPPDERARLEEEEAMRGEYASGELF